MVLRNTKRVEEMEHTVTYVSDVGLQVLAASKRWHSDGTFDAAVVLHEESFLQFYMIHALYKNEMIPCVFALLTYKTKEIYRRLIGELKDGASRLKLRLCPEIAMLDFEASVIDVYSFHFPDIIIKLCHFHFSQNIFKKIVEVGLKVQYGADEELNIWVKKITALAFIPPDNVCDAFVELSENAPAEHELGEFLDYLTINYIDSSTYLFPIEYWSHHDNPGARTNNYLEGYTSRWKNT